MSKEDSGSNYLSSGLESTRNYDSDGTSYDSDWETHSHESGSSGFSSLSQNSTFSSITPYGVERRRSETFGNRYFFTQDAKKGTISIVEQSTSKSGYDITQQSTGLIFHCANYCAALSKTPNDLVKNTTAMAESFLDTIEAIYPTGDLRLCSNKFREKIDAINKLNELIKRTPEEIQDELSYMVDEEKLIACSEIFEDFRQESKKLRKSTKEQVRKIEKDIEQAQKELEEEQSTDETKRELFAENQLLARTIMSTKKKGAKIDETVYSKTVHNVLKEYKNGISKVEDHRLDSDNNDLRLSISKIDDLPEASKEFIQSSPEKGQIHKKIYGLSPEKKDLQRILISGEFLSLSNLEEKDDNRENNEQKVQRLEDDLQHAIIVHDQISQLLEPVSQKTQGNPQEKPKSERTGIAIYHPIKNLVTYTIDKTTLESRFIAKTSERPYTFDSQHQDDHVTAYVALVESFINSLLPIYRARDMVDQVEERLSLVFDDEAAVSSNPRLRGHRHHNCDEKRKKLIKNLSHDFDENDKEEINKLLKIKNLRAVNADICDVANEYLRDINAEEYGTLEQGGKTNAEDAAILYISSLNNFFTYNSLESSIQKALENDLSEQRKTNLQNILGALNDKFSAQQQVRSPSLDFLSTSLNTNQLERIEADLSMNLIRIFDLNLDALRKSPQIINIVDEELKNYQMKEVANDLINRHFRVFGVVIGAALEGIEKSHEDGARLIETLPERFLNSIFDNPSFKDLFSKDFDDEYMDEDMTEEEIFQRNKANLKERLTNILQDRKYTPDLPLGKASKAERIIQQQTFEGAEEIKEEFEGVGIENERINPDKTTKKPTSSRRFGTLLDENTIPR